MRRYLLVFSFLFSFFSCKEEIEPNLYAIRVRSTYFEAVDSLQLGTHYVGRMEPNGISEFIFVSKGVYPFSCITDSELKIVTEIGVRGIEKTITIKLNSKGKVELE